MGANHVSSTSMSLGLLQEINPNIDGILFRRLIRRGDQFFSDPRQMSEIKPSKVPERIRGILDEYDVESEKETIVFDESEFTDRDGTPYFAGGIVHNHEKGLAFVKNEWSQGWITPGGEVEEEETIEEGLVREIKEETGLEGLEVERPLYVSQQEFVCRNIGTSYVGYFVLYSVYSDDTEIGDDLGADDVIHDASWFDGIPEKTHRRDIIESAVERVPEIDMGVDKNA